jgi:hypothetical protein
MSTGATVPTTGNRGGVGDSGSVGGVRRSGAGFGVLTRESKQTGGGFRGDSAVAVEGTRQPQLVEDRPEGAARHAELVRRR